MAILINFFRVRLPTSELPFLTRPLAVGEKLRAGERRLTLPGKDENSTVVKATLVDFDEVDDASAYSTEQVSVQIARPFLVKQVVAASLREFLRANGRVVDLGHIGFLSHDQRHKVPEAPSFITVFRGLEFRADYIEFEKEHPFGFFISTRSRIQFAVSLADPHLAKLASDERVCFKDGARMRSGRLVEFKRGAKTATVKIDDRQFAIPYNEIVVPASSPMIRAYCSSAGKGSLSRKAILAGQIANFRVNSSGYKNPAWLRDQHHFIGLWLNPLATPEGVEFQWMKSGLKLGMDIRPKIIGKKP